MSETAAFFVIARPELDRADYEWIQDYRARHDPEGFKRVDPHFTFVFGVDGMGEGDFVEAVRQQLVGVASIPFELSVATVNYNPFDKVYHEFLVPEAGFAAIVRLHDRLYSGALSGQRNLDLAYMPHICIGMSTRAETARQRVDELNAGGVSIAGRIAALEIVAADDTVRTVDTLRLQDR